jgi:hypothetical protein
MSNPERWRYQIPAPQPEVVESDGCAGHIRLQLRVIQIDKIGVTLSKFRPEWMINPKRSYCDTL